MAKDGGAKVITADSIPCLVVFKGGHETGRLVGAVPKRRIAVKQALVG